MTKAPEEAQTFLTGLGLSPNAPGLAGPPPDAPTTPKREVALVPSGLDPHTIPHEQIVFDPVLLDAFPVLEGEGRNEASKYVFGLYRSLGRDKGRNGALHRLIGEFIGQVKRARAAGAPDAPIKGQVKVNKAQREMAKLLAEHGVDEHELAAFIASKRG